MYEGEITAFLGHNGAGKTTTMFMLTGARLHDRRYSGGRGACPLPPHLPRPRSTPLHLNTMGGLAE